MTITAVRSCCGWMRRHRGKLITSSVVIGGLYGAGKYLELQVKGFMEREKRKMRVESERQATFTQTQEHTHEFLQLMHSDIVDAIEKRIDCESILLQLKRGDQGTNKRDLWKQLKILVFTKLATHAYISCVLTLIASTQLHETAAVMLTQGEKDDDQLKTRHQIFLSETIKKLLCDGLDDIVERIQRYTVEAKDLANVELNTRVNHYFVRHFLEDLFLRIGEDLPEHSAYLAHMVLPVGANVSLCNSMLDVLISPDSELILQSFLEYSAVLMSDATNECLQEILNTSEEAPNIPLAKLIATLNTHTAQWCGVRLVDDLRLRGDFVNFLANVFEAFVVVGQA